MKQTLLTATMLFLISAPAPNSGDIAEITSNFIVPENLSGLQANDEVVTPSSAESASYRKAKEFQHKEASLQQGKTESDEDQATKG